MLFKINSKIVNYRLIAQKNHLNGLRNICLKQIFISSVWMGQFLSIFFNFSCILEFGQIDQIGSRYVPVYHIVKIVNHPNSNYNIYVILNYSEFIPDLSNLSTTKVIKFAIFIIRLIFCGCYVTTSFSRTATSTSKLFQNTKFL